MSLDTIRMFIIFCIVLSIYLHIQYHLKICNDLQLIEFDDIRNYDLDELDKIRQPLIFTIIPEDILLKIPENSDSDSKYEDLEVGGVSNVYNCQKLNGSQNDYCTKYGEFLRPTNAFSSYEIWSGKNSTTPMQYMLHCRFFLIPMNESIRIKLTAPKSGSYLYPQTNMTNFTFTSETDVWNTNTSNIDMIDIVVFPGQYLSIPPHWWFSIKYEGDVTAKILCCKYDTIMCMCANIRPYILYGAHEIYQKTTECIEDPKIIVKTMSSIFKPTLTHSQIYNKHNHVSSEKEKKIN